MLWVLLDHHINHNMRILFSESSFCWCYDQFTKSRVCGAIKSARNGSKNKGRGDDDLDRGQIEHTEIIQWGD